VTPSPSMTSESERERVGLPLLPVIASPVPGMPPGRSAVDQEPTQCTCGNTFMADSAFCRKCGKKRQDDDDDWDQSLVSVADLPEVFTGEVTVRRKKHTEEKTYVEPARFVVRKYMEKETCVMKAWFRHFDKNQNGRIDYQEFKAGMLALRFPGPVEGLWVELDEEELGEIAFDDLCEPEALIWTTFRRWCSRRFQCPREMIKQLKRAYVQVAKTATNRGSDESITEPEFCEGIRLFGWDEGHESTLYGALEPDGETGIAVRDLKWLDLEIRRYRGKEVAKKRALKISEQKAKSKQAVRLALIDFKAFLKKQFGPLFRAWRNALDNDGSMSVQKNDLFKVCRSLNWRGDVRALWKALDHDSSGSSTLEELDPHCAQVLAHFKDWSTGLFGNKPSAAMWQTFDKQRRRKLTYVQFMSECEARGFRGKAKTLAVWLDWQDKKFLQEDDLAILDNWKPPEWLSATPDQQAADDFKESLLKKYGHFLKAWRSAMDKDNSNSCNWHEFQDAAKHLRHSGNIAGAWLAFDEDMSGNICLKEIDPISHHALVEFKLWADEEFGGVRSAFKVLDVDKSNELTYSEFRKACRNYGFPGDIKALFDSLDQHGEEKLQLKEVSFLDDWDVREEGEDEEGGEDPNLDQEHDSSMLEYSHMLNYNTNVPGPGEYDVLPGFGAMPSMPTARHSGAFTFSGRRPLWRVARSVGPANYEPDVQKVRSRKPAWGFGTSSRGGVIDSARKKTVPGPGSYEVKTPDIPRFTMRPRRGISVHPSQRFCRH